MKVVWLPAQELGLAGRLGLGPSPGCGAQNVAEDLADLAAQGVGHLICLLEGEELGFFDPAETLEGRRAAVLAQGMSFLHAPIEDYEAPALAEATALVETIVARLDRGEDVFVHCWAGLGRAGTIVACVLIAQGLSAPDAIALVRWIRPGAIQSTAQEALLHAFAAAQAP